MVKQTRKLQPKPQPVHGAVGRAGEEVGWRGGDAGDINIASLSGIYVSGKVGI
jgi:hypothetical protein